MERNKREREVLPTGLQGAMRSFVSEAPALCLLPTRMNLRQALPHQPARRTQSQTLGTSSHGSSESMIQLGDPSTQLGTAFIFRPFPAAHPRPVEPVGGN